MDKVKGVKPVKRFRAGAVSAAVWENVSEKGSFATINLQRSYKDKDEWKHTESLKTNDLPKAVLVLNQAFEYLVLKEKEENNVKMIVEDVQ